MIEMGHDRSLCLHAMKMTPQPARAPNMPLQTLKDPRARERKESKPQGLKRGYGTIQSTAMERDRVLTSPIDSPVFRSTKSLLACSPMSWPPESTLGCGLRSSRSTPSRQVRFMAEERDRRDTCLN